MKLGIIRCMQAEDYCPGSRDFRTIRERKGAFMGEDDIQLVGFINCGGCPGKKAVLRARSLVEQGADTIAFASCISMFVGSGAVVLPAQLLRTVLFLRGGVFIAADVGGRAFHNIQSVHRVCPFHTVFSQGLYHILCRCVIGCFSRPHLFVRLQDYLLFVLVFSVLCAA